MGNKNVNPNSNFNPLMSQNFLNMGNLLGQNQGNPSGQPNNQQQPGQNNNSAGYPGFINFMNQGNMPYVGIKEGWFLIYFLNNFFSFRKQEFYWKRPRPAEDEQQQQ